MMMVHHHHERALRLLAVPVPLDLGLDLVELALGDAGAFKALSATGASPVNVPIFAGIASEIAGQTTEDSLPAGHYLTVLSHDASVGF